LFEAKAGFIHTLENVVVVLGDTEDSRLRLWNVPVKFE
jgi:hypothetical protein